MSKIIIEIPEKTVEAVCDLCGYTDNLNMTQIEFTEQQIIKYLKEITVAYEYNQVISTLPKIEEPDIKIIKTE